MASGTVPAGRNDPCPCGSGRRYKACHGALAAPGGGSPATSATRAPATSIDDRVRAAMAAHQRGDLALAEREYRTALALAPDHAIALHYLGVIAYQQRRAAEALPLLERAAALVPGEPEFHNNLGLTLAALDRNHEAAAAHRRAIELRPEHAGAWSNLGLVLLAGNDLPGARDAFTRALSVDPSFDQARWNRALALLAGGNYTHGFDDYEARLSIATFASARQPATPRWHGGDPAGRSLLLISEQGMGDTLHFARFATTLAERGARVVLQAPRALLPVLGTLPGPVQLSAAEDPDPPHDAWLPLLSVARALGISTPQWPGPYLQADPALRAAVREALPRREGRMRVGLAWSGSARHVNDARRSIRLARLRGLLEHADIDWISLQKDDADPVLAAEAATAGMLRLPWRNSFEGVAALVAEVDCAVCVDTAIAHLAGALGQRTLVLLPFAPDWRWGLAGTHSAWYPSLRLLRQPAPGDWERVVDLVRHELRIEPGV